MRSFAEIRFRARQEAANLLLFLAKPTFRGSLPARLELPDPGKIAEVLRATPYTETIQAIAANVLQHRFPVLGIEIETGPDIRWRRDYVNGIESAARYLRRIPYLQFAAVGDHKFVWELNRHQHLVVLAQAFLFTGQRKLLEEIVAQLESWFDQNPFQQGINWTSALEVAFRTLSWIWTYHLVAPELPENFLRRWLTELYRHGLHLAENLSIYFSPNTHLLGEAVALHALGKLFPHFPGAEKWRSKAAFIVNAQLSFQVWDDGVHFEQSTYYHVYALDLFVFHYLLADRPPHYCPVLAKMAEYLHWLLGPARRIAFLGDDDGGRLFHPYGDRALFGRSTIATCGILLNKRKWLGTDQDVAEQTVWWLGAEFVKTAETRHAPTGNRLFPNAGAVFLSSGDFWVQIDAGPFGYGGAGHSHSDSLSIVASFRNEWIFLDPGTFTYVGDPAERNWFRGSVAHNTVQIDQLDQGQPAGPFQWASKPEVSLAGWRTEKDGGFVDARCRYRGFTHRRRVLLRPGMLLVFDEIEGTGQHTCHQIWHLGPAAPTLHLSFSAPVIERPSKISPAYGVKLPGQSLVAVFEGSLPAQMAMLLRADEAQSISVSEARHLLGEN